MNSGDSSSRRGPTCETSFEYDHIDDRGHKILVRPIRSPHENVTEIDLTVLFERPGPRYTSNPEILRIEAELGYDQLPNPARPIDDHPTFTEDSDVE